MMITLLRLDYLVCDLGNCVDDILTQTGLERSTSESLQIICYRNGSENSPKAIEADDGAVLFLGFNVLLPMANLVVGWLP